MVSERIDTQLALAALEMAYRRRKPPKGSIPPGPRRSAMCLPIWSLSTIPAALAPLWVGFLTLVLRRNFATPLPNHRYHIPRQSFQVFSCFSVRFSGNGSISYSPFSLWNLPASSMLRFCFTLGGDGDKIKGKCEGCGVPRPVRRKNGFLSPGNEAEAQ